MKYVSVALALTACGTVNGVCPGESNDNVACTADICDLETNQWVHIPENSACASGEVCTTTGCSASPLTGTADLLGYDASDPTRNNAGITVTLVPAAGSTGSGSAVGSGSGSAASLTATTAADGSWSIAAAPGTYTVQYSKAKFVTATTPGVVVGAMGGGTAPAVTLTHYQELDRGANFVSPGVALYLPDELLTSGYSPLADGTQYYATPLDASADAVNVFTGDYDERVYGTTSIVWVDTSSGSVWARPYDGSTPPVLLLTAPIGSTVDVVGTPATYAVIYEHGTVDSLWVAKTDGTASPSTAAWTAPDANHTFAELVNNDTTALFFTNTGTADTQPAHRIDLASNTTVSVSVGVTSTGLYNDDLVQSPDGNWVYGAISATTGTPYRGFVAPLTPTPLSAGITVSSLTGTYADVTDFHDAEWLADSSAFVYTAFAQNGGSPDLREWKTSASSSIEIASSAAFEEAAASDSVHVYGTTVLDYVDYADGYHFYGLNGTGSAVLDASPVGPEHDRLSTVGSNGDIYVVETEGNVPAKVVSIAIPGGNVAAATATVLVPTVASGCNYRDALSDTTFYQLCADTGTLNAYAESNATPTRQLTSVQLAGNGVDGRDTFIAAAPAAEQLVFVGSDYQMYSVTNDGAGSPVVVSSTCDPQQGFMTIGSWLLCIDSTQGLTRVSNLNGSVIDEPLDTCNMLANFEGQHYVFPQTEVDLPTALQIDPSGTRLWSPGATCQPPPELPGVVRPSGVPYQIFRETMTPLANLP